MKKIIGVLIGCVVLTLFCMTGIGATTYAYGEETETNVVSEEKIYELESCQPQGNITLNAKEAGTVAYTATYTEALPSDFGDIDKYQSSKLTISDFHQTSIDEEGNGSVVLKEVTVEDISGKTCVYYLRVQANNKEGTVAIVCDVGDVDMVKIKIEEEASFVDTVSKLLSSSTVLTLIITLAVTVIGRASIKIFRFGVNYKSTFATAEQQEKFENSMREELRNTKTEMQDNILKICLREITRETRPLRDIQSLATGLQTDREILTVRLDAIDQKYNEMRKLADNVNQLEQKVTRLQYSETTSEVRRSAK